MKKLAITFMTMSLLFACGAKEETKQAEGAAPAGTQAAAAAVPGTAVPAATAAATDTNPAAQAMAQAAAAGKLTGTVLETMDGGGYTYIKVKTDKGEEWAATPAVKVKKGDKVSIAPQMTAEKFESTTLKRKFDKIVFGTVEAPGAAGAAPAAMAGMTGQMPPGHPPMGGAQGGVPPAMAAAMGSPTEHMKAKATGPIEVEKANVANGKTVAEVWAQRAALTGKPVVIRGKVVKFLGGIMGTNFMHVRDGSGAEAKGDHDITVTTNEAATVGDVVVVTGVVTVDKDFGAGYRYPVIVENAKITK